MRDLQVIDRITDEPLADLFTNSANITRAINSEFYISFECPEQELKTEYLEGNSVLSDGQTFDIKTVSATHSTGGSIIYKCEGWHVYYRLTEETYISYAYSGTPAQILTNILSGTDFTVGQVDFITPITFAVNEETNKSRLIVNLASILGGEIEYTGNGYEINILDTIGQNNGFEIRYAKNLQGITKVYDEREGTPFTRYEVTILALKDSDQYIKQGLSALETINLGDTVYVIDDATDTDILQRIIRISYDPRRNLNTEVEIADKIIFFTDDVTNIQQNSVNKGSVYYGIQISPEVGFKTERSDLLARSLFNADTFQMDVGDGLGGYTPAVYFDPIEGKYKFIGDIEASGTITGATIIGSSINNGSGTFLVDAAGNVTANSLTANGAIISGAITITSGSGISNLSDAGALATQNDITSSQVTDAGTLITKDGVDFLIPGEILNAGLLAVADYVDMSTGDVINKIADNISETITRKWAAESGADVTLNNTAAGFVNQGLVSVLDSISSTYIDDGAIITPKLAAKAVVASKISVSTLDAISANLGTITAGNITATTTINVGTDLAVGENIKMGFTTSQVDRRLSFGNTGTYIEGNTDYGLLGYGMVFNAPQSTFIGDVSMGISGSAFYDDGAAGSNEIATRGWVLGNFLENDVGASGTIDLTTATSITVLNGLVTAWS